MTVSSGSVTEESKTSMKVKGREIRRLHKRLPECPDVEVKLMAAILEIEARRAGRD